MEEKPNLNPIERAKSLIKEKKDQNLSKEELEKQEEQNRLNLLFAQVQDLYNQLKEVMSERSSSSKEIATYSSEYSNQTSSIKQALDLLRSNPETSTIFKKDYEGGDKDHKIRFNISEQVFGDIKNERRETKQKLKKAKENDKELGNNYISILREIHNLINSPDGKKLDKLKEDEKRQIEYDRGLFLNDKDKANNLYLYKETQGINSFSKNKEKEIKILKETLKDALNEMLSNIQRVFINAENSEEYKPKEFGPVDFEKYKKLIPNLENLKMKIYNHDSDIEFKQLSWEGDIYKSIFTDVNEISRLKDKKRDDIRVNSGKFFSGNKKREEDYKRLDKKEQFLRKIWNSVEKYERDFKSKEMEDLKFSDHRKANRFSQNIACYINSIRSDRHSLRNESDFPDFNNKPFTFDSLFRFAKQNDIAVSWEDAFKEFNKIEERMLKNNKELELIKEAKAIPQV